MVGGHIFGGGRIFELDVLLMAANLCSYSNKMIQYYCLEVVRMKYRVTLPQTVTRARNEPPAAMLSSNLQ